MNCNKTGLNRNTDVNKRVLCQLKEIGSCFGCCGNNFKGEKAVMKGIKKNAILLRQLIKKHDSMDNVFDDLNSNYFGVRECGICFALINFKSLPNIENYYDIYPKELVDDDKIFGCPMHPIINDREKRVCEIEHECKSYNIFEKMSRKKQDEFIEFLKKKIEDEKLTSYQYSIGLDDGSLIDEFLKE